MTTRPCDYEGSMASQWEKIQMEFGDNSLRWADEEFHVENIAAGLNTKETPGLKLREPSTAVIEFSPEKVYAGPPTLLVVKEVATPQTAEFAELESVTSVESDVSDTPTLRRPEGFFIGDDLASPDVGRKRTFVDLELGDYDGIDPNARQEPVRAYSPYEPFSVEPLPDKSEFADVNNTAREIWGHRTQLEYMEQLVGVHDTSMEEESVWQRPVPRYEKKIPFWQRLFGGGRTKKKTGIEFAATTKTLRFDRRQPVVTLGEVIRLARCHQRPSRQTFWGKVRRAWNGWFKKPAQRMRALTNFNYAREAARAALCDRVGVDTMLYQQRQYEDLCWDLLDCIHRWRRRQVRMYYARISEDHD